MLDSFVVFVVWLLAYMVGILGVAFFSILLYFSVIGLKKDLEDLEQTTGKEAVQMVQQEADNDK
ncbi:MAG: hypothetical protein IKD77_01905 [Bacilli bacterium]|nr:hypothetical protein [Bacilli bacterium]